MAFLAPKCETFRDEGGVSLGEMSVVASLPALEFIRDHGGQLFVWAGGAVCVRPGAGHLPDELDVDLKGIRRRRIEASWNGCAYLL